MQYLALFGVFLPSVDTLSVPLNAILTSMLVYGTQFNLNKVSLSIVKHPTWLGFSIAFGFVL